MSPKSSPIPPDEVTAAMSLTVHRERPLNPPARPEGAGSIEAGGAVAAGVATPLAGACLGANVAGVHDPRLDSDFDARYWPLCNGSTAPHPSTTDHYERRCLEFLGAFYRVNRANAAVVASDAESAGPDQMRALREALAATVLALEALEDRHAPGGFYGDPKMNGVFYADVRFIRPGLPKIPGGSSITTPFLQVAGLHEIPESELRGTPTIRRWRHGKTYS